MATAKTKEMRFMIALYRLMRDRNDYETPVNTKEVAKVIGLHDKSVQLMCKGLRRANFIKILDEEDNIIITPQGIELAKCLLGQT